MSLLMSMVLMSVHTVGLASGVDHTFWLCSLGMMQHHSNPLLSHSLNHDQLASYE